ncbi:hypothetical protein RI054_31g122650 [Pseudoscourfieldia marina]
MDEDASTCRGPGALLDEALDMSFEDLHDLVSSGDDDDFVVRPLRDDVRTPRNQEARTALGGAPRGWDASSALNYDVEDARARQSRGLHRKEGFPTIALNVVSGPRRSCTFIGDAQPGARNDKAICKICPSVASLRQDKTLQWQLETPGGVLQMTGAYVLVDGGYVKYAQLMAPYKTTTDAAKALWSKRLESVRKEVEALFGEWRARWAVMRRPRAR